MKKILLLFLTMICLISCSPTPAEDSSNSDGTVISDTVVNTSDTTVNIYGPISNIKRDSILISSTNFKSMSKGTIKDMSESIDLLEKYVDAGQYGPFNVYEINYIKKNPKTVTTLNSLSKKSKLILKQVLPSYRKSFAKNLANVLWEKDVYVTCSGSNSDILNITGGIFASNENIKDCQIIVQSDASHFKFKQVRYRWYRGEDEYTSYTLN